MYSKKNLKWALSILIEFSCVIGIDPGISGLTIIPIYPGKFNPGADVKWNFDINERVLVHKMNSTTACQTAFGPLWYWIVWEEL